MAHCIKSVVCWIATLSRGAALAQVTPAEADASAQVSTTSSPVAYVYVSSSPSSGRYEINAYAAASNGSLSIVPGWPLTANVQYMAGTGKYLFSTNGVNIDSFSIASNGSLNQVSTINAQVHNPYAAGGPGNLFLDHTGTTFNDGDTDAYGAGSNAYQFFTIDKSTGQLNYLGPRRADVLDNTFRHGAARFC